MTLFASIKAAVAALVIGVAAAGTAQAHDGPRGHRHHGGHHHGRHWRPAPPRHCPPPPPRYCPPPRRSHYAPAPRYHRRDRGPSWGVSVGSHGTRIYVRGGRRH